MEELALNDHIENFKTPPEMELPWLNELRRQAIHSFKEQGLPNWCCEDWKYTDISKLADKKFLPPSANISRIHAAPSLDNCYRLDFVNGQLLNSSQLKQFPAGIIILPLSTALTTHQELVAKNLGKTIKLTTPGIAALNSCLFSEGLFIYLPKNHVLDKPLHIVYHHNENQSMCHLRNLIVTEDNAAGTIIEHYTGDAESSYFLTSVSELGVGNNSQLQHYTLQQQSAKATHLSLLSSHCQRDSLLQLFNFDFGGQLVRHDTVANLDAPGASCQLIGLYLLDQRQHVDNHTVVNHNQPQTHSEEFYKGILNGRARGVFNGKVLVKTDAQQISALQNNHNLLLSNDAEIDTKPQLEIFADNVQCSHGATIVQLDKTALFYLQSRGVEPTLAHALLTFGFAREVIEKIPCDKLKPFLRQATMDQLGAISEIGDLL